MRKKISTLFDLANNKSINTWDIQWFYTCLFNNGLSVIPKSNLISNIGLKGTHTEGTHVYNNLPLFNLDTVDMLHPDLVYPNYCYDNEFFKHYRKVTFYMKLKHVYRTISKICGVKPC
jgi:hypothetical protein